MPNSLTADNLMRLEDMDTEEDPIEASTFDRGGALGSDSGSSARFDSEEERQDRLITPRELEEIESLQHQTLRSAAMQQTTPLDRKYVRLKPHHSDEGSDESGPTTWYFAYGSNMNVAQLLTRIGSFTEKKLMFLQDYKLTFNKKVSLKARHGRMDNMRGTDPSKLGFANVVPSPGDRVYGIAYSVFESQVQKMDLYEGVNSGHYTREVLVCYDEAYQAYSCVVYIACPTATSDNLLPSEGYMSHLLGGRGLLPPDYVNMLDNVPRAKK